MTYDGGGNDGYGRVYAGVELEELAEVSHNLGGSYSKVGVPIAEITGGVDAYAERCAGTWSSVMRCALGVAGKTMGRGGRVVVVPSE